MLGPLLGTGLYEIAPGLPYAFGTVLLAGMAVFAFAHPGIRREPAPVTAAAVLPVEVNAAAMAAPDGRPRGRAGGPVG